ncbi:hypothetical protein [Undibacterium sp. RuRC25W]|uniref:hypothetical protein n=1 Tax=Undibacterium sp. RuRC25W TaxID=3413047 RepID=UPI003BF16B54
MTQPDNRNFHRVQFFRLSKNQGFIPVWVFNRDGDADSLPALVVDMSESGMQVLTSFEEKIRHSAYKLRILDEGEVQMDMPLLHLKHIWSTPEGGMHVRSGFSFQNIDRDTVVLVMDRMKSRDQQYIRCTLTPIFTV